MANAFLQGLIAGRANKQNRLDETRRQAEEARTTTDFENRQAGLADLQGEFGDRAFTPTEFGQLQGTTDRAKAADQTRQRTAGFIKDDETDRRTAATANGLRLFDTITQKAIADGQDPTLAVQGVINNMQPQARELFGFNDPGTVQGMLQQVEGNPNFFGEQLKALIPPKTTSTSRAAMKAVEGIDPETGEQVFSVFDPNTGTFLDAEGAPIPRNRFAPKTVGGQVQTFDNAGQFAGAVDVTGALEAGAAATETGRAVGGFVGDTRTEDMQLSQTKSNEVGQLIRSRRSGLERVSSVIDDAIAQTDWDSAGTIQGLKRVDGSTAANLSATLSTVQANATLDKLMEIKAAGATLGQITEKELELLRNSVSALEQSQSPAQLRANLEAYKDQLAKTVAAMESDYKADIERGRIRPMSGSTPKQRVSAADFLGGN